MLADSKGFVVLPKRWVVERTHAWSAAADDRLLSVSAAWVWLTGARCSPADSPLALDYVNTLLVDHFEPMYSWPTVVAVPDRGRRHAAVPSWPAARTFHHLREDPRCVATTMVDYYGMPQDGQAAWPDRTVARTREPSQRSETVEAAIAADVGREMGESFDRRRFIPYVVMHEFEALLFSDCDGLARGVGCPDLASSFQAILNHCGTPEEIDDSPDCAPSKRIERILPAYQKSLHGNLAALEIGLRAMRAECPGFRSWLGRLESLGDSTATRSS